MPTASDQQRSLLAQILMGGAAGPRGDPYQNEKSMFANRPAAAAAVPAPAPRPSGGKDGGGGRKNVDPTTTGSVAAATAVPPVASATSPSSLLESPELNATSPSSLLQNPVTPPSSAGYTPYQNVMPNVPVPPPVIPPIPQRMVGNDRFFPKQGRVGTNNAVPVNALPATRGAIINPAQQGPDADAYYRTLMGGSGRGQWGT